jgi:hypothetical protein
LRAKRSSALADPTPYQSSTLDIAATAADPASTTGSLTASDGFRRNSITVA